MGKPKDEIRMPDNFFQESSIHNFTKAFNSSWDIINEALNQVNKTIPEWVEENRVLNGKPFSYNEGGVHMMLGNNDKPSDYMPRPYLMEYLKDDCRDKTIIKCRQSELSENEININFYLCANKTYFNVMHVFPSTRLAEKFAKQKLISAIKRSPKLYELVEKPIASTFNRFMNGSNYIVEGSYGDMAGRAFSVDKITFDEFEMQKPTAEEVFESTLSHSKYHYITRISTPLLPNGGIDAKYNESCQFEWEITCPDCGIKQTMTFPESIVGYFELEGIKIDSPEHMEKIKQVYIGCKHCGGYIDRTSPFYIKNSKWIARQPHLVGYKNGYRVTAFMLAWKTGREILYRYHKARYIHQFYNEVLGYAYLSPDAKLNESLFYDCVVPIANAFQGLQYMRNVSVGVDWGPYESWCVVRANGMNPDREKPIVIYVERIDEKSLKQHGYLGRPENHVERVEEIAHFFKADIIINDANSIGVDRNSYLIKRFPNRAFGCFFDTHEIERQKRRTKIIEPQWTKDKVTVSKVGSARQVMQEFLKREIGIPQIDENVKEFVEHHCNVGIERFFDEKTGEDYEVVGRTGKDHFFCANLYSWVGFEKIYNRYGGSPGVI